MDDVKTASENPKIVWLIGIVLLIATPVVAFGIIIFELILSFNVVAHLPPESKSRVLSESINGAMRHGIWVGILGAILGLLLVLTGQLLKYRGHQKSN